MKTPQLQEEKIRGILEANGVNQDRVAVVAVRGYYLDSMGKPGRNDRGIYDDAQFIVWPDGIARFQGNTDPSRYRTGSGYGSRKGMAVLKTGLHIFGTGTHRGTLAFRQCEPFTVLRDGDNGPYLDQGWHAINWHRGGYSGTSSLGCQTTPRGVFLKTVRPLMYSLLHQYRNTRRRNDWGQRVRCFPYLLIAEQERRKGNLIVSRRYL